MTHAQLLKGKEIAERIRQHITRDVVALQKQHALTPKIVALAVGESEASDVYLKSQKRIADAVGIAHEVVHLPASARHNEVVGEIHELNAAADVHGIIVQMPLPGHLSFGKVINELDPEKDIEGIHADNLGLLVLRKGKLAPCTALAVMELIESTGVSLYGKEAVVVGASRIVGNPVSLLLAEKMATVTLCHIGTAERGHLEEHVRRAEVLIVAVGKPQLIPGEWIREGSIIIDVGINRVDGKIIGDVVFDDAEKKAAYITPVPGGVGPLTATILMRNAITAFTLQQANGT